MRICRFVEKYLNNKGKNLFDFLIGALIGPLVSYKISNLLGSGLMAIAGIFFGYYSVYLLVAKPFNSITIFLFILMLFLSIGSFYLMLKVWKSRNEQ
jgi:uncharacterized membrane protein HdeD (DUF308 family)